MSTVNSLPPSWFCDPGPPHRAAEQRGYVFQPPDSLVPLEPPGLLPSGWGPHPAVPERPHTARDSLQANLSKCSPNKAPAVFLNTQMHDMALDSLCWCRVTAEISPVSDQLLTVTSPGSSQRQWSKGQSKRGREKVLAHLPKGEETPCNL